MLKYLFGKKAPAAIANKVVTAPPALSVGATAPGMVRAMPRGKARYRRGGARMKGRGIMDMLRKAHAFIKKHKLISRGSNALSYVLPEKYKGIASKVSGVSGSLGYGRRKRGGALRLSGGALRLAGAGMVPRY